jgi:uncharacterized protein YjbI with pentapeptide repeats
MSPQVEAAIIAASVGVLTLIATVVTQYLGRRATSRDTEKTLDRTLAEQREQLDKTLAEQGRQLDRTLAEQRTQTLNERFATAADQLGSDKHAAVRLAGVHAMAGLADDWAENRQTCVDVLCAYLRLHYDPDPDEDTAPGEDASMEVRAAYDAERAAYRTNREVRHTIIRLIAAHLREGAAVSWEGLNLDFTGAVFDGGNFVGVRFSGGIVRFDGAKFSGGKVDFYQAEFSGGEVSFDGTEFSSQVSFDHAEFSGSDVYFSRAKFSGGEVSFVGAEFSGGMVSFGSAEFSGGDVNLVIATFSGGEVGFGDARFSGGEVTFAGAKFSGGEVNFGGADLSEREAVLLGARFSGGKVSFQNAQFSGGRVSFFDAWFSGGQVNFDRALFSGGKVDFSEAADWSNPPAFPWADMPPPGVKLPKLAEGAGGTG